MRKYRKSLLLFLAGCCLFAFSAVGTQAYLVEGSDKVWSRFIPGNVAAAIKQTQQAPSVINQGSLDAWIFLEVSIPREMIRCVDPVTRKKTEAKKSNLISFQENKGWKLLRQKETETQMLCLYGYERPIAPKESTTPLFDDITVVKYLEGELGNESDWTVPIKVFAVQGNIVKDEEGLEEADKTIWGGDAL